MSAHTKSRMFAQFGSSCRNEGNYRIRGDESKEFRSADALPVRFQIHHEKSQSLLLIRSRDYTFQPSDFTGHT